MQAGTPLRSQPASQPLATTADWVVLTALRCICMSPYTSSASEQAEIHMQACTPLCSQPAISQSLSTHNDLLDLTALRCICRSLLLLPVG
jgi:hypothetical protein